MSVELMNICSSALCSGDTTSIDGCSKLNMLGLGFGLSFVLLTSQPKYPVFDSEIENYYNIIITHCGFITYKYALTIKR